MNLPAAQRTASFAILLFTFWGRVMATEASAASSPSSTAPHRPKLMVVLVIDQFRADYLLRFDRRFLPAQGHNGEVGGFHYLMTQGAYFPMAEYGILQSMTCPGHATVLTGAYPYQAGIPLNFWYDSQAGRSVYCAEDSDFKTVGAPSSEHLGTSPKNLIASTVGDELKNAGFPSRVISIALKDRAAIMMGGHRADLAFWMDGKERAWVSSSYYLKSGKLPEWLKQLNVELQGQTKGTYSWTAEGPGSGLTDPNFRPKSDSYHIGSGFPHNVPITDKGVLALPYGLEITETAAERAVAAYKLGQAPSTDILAISFSSHDYLGHAFGPNSREMEEMTVQEDRVISKFLNHLRKNVPGGLSEVVFALTGDHGSPNDPQWLQDRGMDAGAIDEGQMDAVLEKALNEKFGSPRDDKWISFNHDFDIFVNRKVVASKKAELQDVLNEVKSTVKKMRGVAHAFTSFDFEARHLPPGLHEEQILHTYFPGRSGDVVIIPIPGYMVVDADSVAHLSGYNYDRMVPLILAGPHIRAGNYPQHARVIDLAPTLSYLLGILPPNQSEGRVLAEAIASGVRP